jgi:tetraacyldisaccharide 4'-kinase
MLYARQILKSRKLPRPVICVGNLTVGGTGKTPIVAYLALRLKECGLNPVVLSRGYRGRRIRSTFLVSDGSAVVGNPTNCGDEPYLLARKLEGIIVAVGKNRFKAGQAVGMKTQDPVFIMDDGYQHLKLERDLDLLLIDGSRSLNSEALLPLGTLREPLSAMARADAILITRQHLISDLPGLVKQIRRWNPTAPIFPFSQEIEEVYSLESQQRIPLSELRGQKVVVLAAIGHPEQFLYDIERTGMDVQDRFLFPDHHNFSREELATVLNRCQQLGAVGVITTEKDAVRLEKLEIEKDRIFVLSIKVVTRDPATFLNWVLQKLAKANTGKKQKK